MSGEKAKGGKKGRKYGKNATRSPSMKRYRAEQRWITNKKKKVARHLRKQMLHAKKRGCHYDKQAEKWLKAA